VVMMMTAYAVEELVQEALQEGAYGITYKPLDIERVIALIERVRMRGREGR
jgi:DNA-binding NtrC family response regulator